MQNNTIYLLRNKVTGLFAMNGGSYYWEGYCFNNSQLNALIYERHNHNLPAAAVLADIGWADPTNAKVRSFGSAREVYLHVRGITNRMARMWRQEEEGRWGKQPNQAIIALGKPDKQEWLRNIFLNTEMIPAQLALMPPQDWQTVLPKSLRKLI